MLWRNYSLLGFVVAALLLAALTLTWAYSLLEVHTLGPVHWYRAARIVMGLGRHRLEAFLFALGPYAAIVFVLIQALQVVIAPIPGELTGVIGGYVFGKGVGLVLSMIGLTLGSWIAFEISRRFGKQLVCKIVPSKVVDKLASVPSERVTAFSLLFFLLPGLPKDYLCFVLGLTPMGRAEFLFASTLGRLPGTFLLSAQGGTFRDHNYTAVAAIILFSLVLCAGAYFYRERLLRQLAPDAKRSNL